MLKRRYSLLLIACLFLTMVAGFLLALQTGEYTIPFSHVFDMLTGGIHPTETDARNTEAIILWHIRMPRLLLACITGMALAASGAVYQGCFRNPLVEPYLLGVSSGAAWGAALAIVFPSFIPSSQLSSFLFAIAAVLIAFSLARSHGRTPSLTLILAGIIVGSLFSAFVGIMKYLATDTELREITFWLMGGFYYATWHDVMIAASTVLPCLLLLTLLAWKLNVLSLGDEEARSLGLHPDRVRALFLVLATLSVSVCVSSTGIIAWVGLMMPHAVRMLFGPDNRFVIPCSSLLGAIYLLLCDTLARTLTGAEIPIAIITSIVGAPYLLWLLKAKGRELYGN